MQQRTTQIRLARYLSWWYGLILALLPFHAVITTWLGSNFGHLDAWRIWKELAVFATVPLVLSICLTHPRLKQWFKTDWLVRLIGLYALWFIALGIWAFYRLDVNGPALIYSWLSNLRYLGFMLLVMPVSALSDFLARNWLKLLLGPAMVVIIFGLLQRYVLSYDFLRHFGYGPDTIPAYQTVDQKLTYRRVQSSLRGANPLGAYLVLILSSVASQLWRPRLRMLLSGLMLGGLIVLGFTYSRSAWLALLPSVGLLMWWQYPAKAVRQGLVIGLVAVLAIGAGSLALARRDRVLQNTFFHTDSTSLSPQSSNASRLSALKVAAIQYLNEPLGRGPGTAGPASFRNSGHEPRIAENYFLQIGQEVGWIGFILFIAINAEVARRLWERRKNRLALMLLASWVGLTLVNMVSHAWADDTLGLLFFGLAGIALAPRKTAKKR